MRMLTGKVDFFRKLERNPERPEIPGGGRQNKSCLYVDDALEATLASLKTESLGWSSQSPWKRTSAVTSAGRKGLEHKMTRESREMKA